MCISDRIIKEQSIAVENLIDQFSDVDLIFIEGLKFSAWPKLEVVRSDNSSGPVCDPATLLALVCLLYTSGALENGACAPHH